MKQRLLFLFAFLVTMITGTWADEWSYTTDFQGTGTTGTNGEAIVGAGQFMTDNSQGAKFANFYRNSGNEMRSSYLRLPDDVLSHSTETMQLTIAFWVRAQSNAASGTYNFVPMFTAYGAAPVNNENTFPMFACQYRGLLQVNNWGWCDYVNEQNVNGANTENFNWLDDKEWHLYTAVFNTDTAKVYFDGVLINKWIAYNYGGITDTWQRGLFSNGADLDYICLGGNQSWNWPDNDSPFDYAHLTVSNAAWTDQKICDEACSILGHDYDANDICTRCGKSKSAVALTTPLTFEAIAEGTLVVSNPKTGMQYSVNEGPKTIMTGDTYIYTVAGDRVQFYGNGTSITQYGSDNGTGTTIRGNSGAYNVYGNIMSLVDEENYNTATAVGDYAFAALFSYNTALLDASNLLLPATTLGEACYSDLFGGCSSLTAAPALPATTLAANCYRAMFEGCSLTEAPALPATTLGTFCYCFMFQNCSSLTAAPALPATTLAEGCYQSMFENCTGLTTAPVLPATTLAGNCYGLMFRGCTGLTAAPELPATTLAAFCYGEMFDDCTGLTAAPALPATTLNYSCYQGMFKGCTGLTTAPELPATTLAESCYNSMFKDCTGLTAAPELPATELTYYCYQKMFSGCTNLASVTCKATDISASDCTTDWLKDVAATGTFTPADNTVAWVKDSPNGIPTGWTRVDVALATPLTIKALTAGTIKVNNPKAGMKYNKKNGTTSGAKGLLAVTDTKIAMSGTTEINVDAGDEVEFYGDGTNITSYNFTKIAGGTAQCSVYGNIMSLVDEENFATATTLTSNSAFNSLFLENTNLTDASGLLLPATTLSKSCYYEMFGGCTGLTAAPELPATELTEYCYNRMFMGCTGLTVAPALPATTLASYCYEKIFEGCTGLTAAPELPATTLAWGCYNRMFMGCIGLTAAPELPATELTCYCYSRMFMGCTGLTAAPELPATTLVGWCYSYMFSGCTNLSSVTCLATDFYATDCTEQWLNGVAATGTFFVSNNTVAWAKESANGIPTGWTRQSMDPLETPLTIEATSDGTIKVNSPKTGMKYSLNGGTKTTMTGTTEINVTAGDKVQFYGNGTNITKYQGTGISGGTAACTVYGNIMSLVDEENFATATTLADNAFYYLFVDNPSLTDASGLLLPATTLSKCCYLGMFYLCTNLTAAPALPATTLAEGCYGSMFENCTALTVAPELPATTLAYGCYNSMFYSCPGLTTAPELPATTLAGYCYYQMFSGCTNLSSVTCLATDISATNCTNNWLKDVAATGTFIAANNTVAWVKDSESGVPTGWTYNIMVHTHVAGEPQIDDASKVDPTCTEDGGYDLVTKCSLCGEEMAREHVDIPALGHDFVNGICTRCGETMPGVAPALTIEATSAGTIKVDSPKPGMKYSLNGGAKTAMSGTTEINVNVGDKVRFYGDGTNITGYDGTTISGGTAECKVYGNIMSLVDEESFTTATTLVDYAFTGLLYENTKLTDASGLLLPATTLSKNCYESMFEGCTGLTAAPELPATTLAESCYSYMFAGCTGLTAAPELPATTLAERCYVKMFYGCSALTEAPALPATTLAVECYVGMFEDCTALTAAPELPATTLAKSCYEQMFDSCTGLTAGPALPATTLAGECYNSMFNKCTGLTAAPELPAMTMEAGCYVGMFLNCTALTTAPELPATTLAEGCYSGMFMLCTGLTSAPALPATTLAEGCYTGMFYGCTGLTATPALPATTLAESCYYAMFYGCTSLTAAPELPATTLANYCYAGMFDGCTSLTKAPALTATTLADYCYYGMFSGCTNLSSVTCLATDISATDCTTDWLKDVAPEGIFTAADGDVAWVKDSPSGIPTGWTIETGATVNTPLTIKAMSAGTIKVTDPKEGMKYTLNGGEMVIMSGTTTIDVAMGDKVQLYGNSTKITSYSGTRINGGTATIAVEGNIMSLVNEDNFAKATILSGSEAFMALFKDNTMLTDVSGLLMPATKVGESSYSQMFSGCTALTAAPELPATTLGEFCYSQMFEGCTGLTAAPELPATEMARGCYNQMFKGCTGLTAAPALPATTLAESCYNQMFYGCTALTTASALPATTVDVLSYNQMFYGCSALTTAPALPATKLAVECYFAMFQGCESLTAAPTLPATTLAEFCYSNMFRDCAGLTAAPALPAATLVKGCYSYMFMGCKNLSAVTCLATDISATGCTEQWLEGVAETGVFTPADETVAWEIDSASGIPAGWNGGTPTGLNKVNANEEGTVVYDFMGRRVKNARRGMFIQNGKKIVKNW